MAFTEFCCRSGGSNLNAGTRTGNSTEPGVSADYTYASGTWVSATGVFTVAAGNPLSDGVAVGDFASVYADGAAVTTLVGRVTARDATTITVSTTAKAGATTDGTSNRTLKIGGAWQGPNGASGFPFILSTSLSSLTNSAGDVTRFNLKNAAAYNITAAITQGAAPTTAVVVEGYATAYGDGGRAIIDGGSGVGFTLFGGGTVTRWILRYIDLTASFSSGTGNGFIVSGGGTGLNLLYRCRVGGVLGIGFQTSSNSTQFVECEAHGCSTGFLLTHGGAGIDTCVDCIAHDNTGVGFLISSSSPVQIRRCIADTNGSHGFHVSGNPSGLMIEHCDAYFNGGDGLRIASANAYLLAVRNSNFVRNGGWGINAPSTSCERHMYFNCGFGAGTMANTSGTINNTVNAISSGHVTYASDVTPWTDPASGDFRISLAAAMNAGRGSFLQLASGYAGAVGYPDIGAAQALGGNGRPTLPFLQQVIG